MQNKFYGNFFYKDFYTVGNLDLVFRKKYLSAELE